MPAKVPAPATRERILVYLQENRTTSVQALSRAWGLTRADIRYHFNALIEEGLVELAPRDTNLPAGKGRPVQYYRLVTGRAPDNLAVLSHGLLCVLLETASQEAREGLLREVALKMTGHAAAENHPTPIQRLNMAVASLGQQGYRARWEAHASGPRILLRNCPYAAILEKHPEICTLDRFLIEALTGSRVHQTAKMNLHTGKPPACIFALL